MIEKKLWYTFVKYFHPEAITFKATHLRKLFCDITTNKHSFKINPQILHSHPLFNDFRCSTKFINPGLNSWLKWNVISGKKKKLLTPKLKKHRSHNAQRKSTRKNSLIIK